VGYKHTREEILVGAEAVALADGLSRLTFGRVARHLGISDRTVVYYFPSKDDLAEAVLLTLGSRLQAALAPAFSDPADDHVGLARAAWPVLASDTVDPTFALFFEATGLAAAGRDPYRTVVPGLVEAWVAWAATLIRGASARRRAEAGAAIALLDGLLLMRQMLGAEAADRAARRLGLR
jgi:AcrR family transcriptional regulator